MEKKIVEKLRQLKADRKFIYSQINEFEKDLKFFSSISSSVGLISKRKLKEDITILYWCIGICDKSIERIENDLATVKDIKSTLKSVKQVKKFIKVASSWIKSKKKLIELDMI